MFLVFRADPISIDFPVNNSGFMDVALAFDQYTTIEQVSRKFPFLEWAKNMFLSIARIASMREMVKISMAGV